MLLNDWMVFEGENGEWAVEHYIREDRKWLFDKSYPTEEEAEIHAAHLNARAKGFSIPNVGEQVVVIIDCHQYSLELTKVN